jgi:hypothetical protein
MRQDAIGAGLSPIEKLLLVAMFASLVAQIPVGLWAAKRASE